MHEAPGIIRLSPSVPADVRGDAAYWDCHLSNWERLLLLLAFVASVLLHLTPILESGAALHLLVGLATLCFLSPLTGFFYIGSASVLPFPDATANEIIRTSGLEALPESMALSPVKIGVMVWAVVVFFRYWRLSLLGLTAMWRVVPWLLWVAAVMGWYAVLGNSEYAKSLIYCVMACQLASESQGRHLKCLLGLMLGCLVVILPYWAYYAGLPVELSDWGPARGGVARMGSVRADAVMLWPPVLIGIAGLSGLVLALGSTRGHQAMPRWLVPLLAILFIASIPPLVSTLTYGAYAGFALLVFALGWAYSIARRQGPYARWRLRFILPLALFVSIAIALLYLTESFGLSSRLGALFESYRETKEEFGAALSRTEVWKASLRTISEYPLFGFVFHGAREDIPSQYVEQGYYLSHSVFLDQARYSGLPGMALLAWFFVWPALKMWQTGERVRYLPFLLAHFAMFIFWMSLSFPFYKTFWALWMLMAMAVARTAPEQVAARRHRPGSPTTRGSKPELTAA